jgi:hypothetical protein
MCGRTKLCTHFYRIVAKIRLRTSCRLRTTKVQSPRISSVAQAAIQTSSSQTGSYLRDFLYHGFNEDESHRKVFDVVNVNIAGTTRVFISMRFADPNDAGGRSMSPNANRPA